MTALTRYQTDKIEADREAEYLRVVSRNTPARARHLIRRWLSGLPGGTNQAYRAMAWLQWTGDADGDAQRAVDEYFAN